MPLHKNGKAVPSINLKGRLAGILALASKKQTPPKELDGAVEESAKLVAGARN